MAGHAALAASFRMLEEQQRRLETHLTAVAQSVAHSGLLWWLLAVRRQTQEPAELKAELAALICEFVGDAWPVWSLSAPYLRQLATVTNTKKECELKTFARKVVEDALAGVPDLARLGELEATVNIPLDVFDELRQRVRDGPHGLLADQPSWEGYSAEMVLAELLQEYEFKDIAILAREELVENRFCRQVRISWAGPA
mmetsp:Transcript_55364/g.164621  ORF Transcript_55364/g.164621 Transcript_55364/m.164621 type:complete len:198 (-) Transcript_55364:68-661(-)